MHTITVKYAGECVKCGTSLAVGNQAVYERHIGIFCVNCAPTDPEELRSYRQEAADRRADRYEEWAAKRRASAGTILAHTRQFTTDIAFNTQPGPIPLRKRILAHEDRAHESLATAERFERKAESLRHVRVAGDAEAQRQSQRDSVLSWLRVGQTVETAMYGRCEVVRINRKTATVRSASQGFTVNVDLSWLRPA